ncbi:MAG: phosphoribosylanthranilate isomerase [Chthoniobacterales bacterium]|nr:phosphoribosylanthranilate isomerase [Chthoniobacterales bacterium]
MFDFGRRVAVKICGVTSVPDALVCATAGADLIGLNFSTTSPRCLAPVRAAEIVATTRPLFPRVSFVGVFVDQPSDFVQNLAHELSLAAVQLHGAESPAEVARLSPIFTIKALRVRSSSPTIPATDYRCDAILLDTWSAQVPGGTGEIFPWSLAAELLPQVPRLILAGGLTSANVAAALAVVRPFAVDVCSGVEKAPGRKDAAKVREFIAAVQAAEGANVAIRA